MPVIDVPPTVPDGSPAQPQRKPWATPRVILSEVQRQTKGGPDVISFESTAPGTGAIVS
jgi:hypothetical protein